MNTYELKPSIFGFIIGIISTLFGLALIVVLTTGFAIDEPGESFSVIAMLILFCGGGIFMIIFYFNYRVILSEKSLSVKGYHGRTKELEWSEIQSAEFKLSKTRIIFKSKNDKISVDVSSVNDIEFLNILNSIVRDEHLEKFMGIGSKFYLPKK